MLDLVHSKLSQTAPKNLDKSRHAKRAVLSTIHGSESRRALEVR